MPSQSQTFHFELDLFFFETLAIVHLYSLQTIHHSSSAYVLSLSCILVLRYYSQVRDHLPRYIWFVCQLYQLYLKQTLVFSLP